MAQIGVAAGQSAFAAQATQVWLWALQTLLVAFAAQSVFAAHSTQAPVVTLQTGRVGVAVQSVLLTQIGRH